MSKPFQSKLAPHFELIRELRLKRRSWKEIATYLHTTHGISTAASSCFEFFKRHRRRPVPLGFPEEEVKKLATPPANSGALEKLNSLKSTQAKPTNTFKMGDDVSR